MLFLFFVALTYAFYLPGTTPVDFVVGQTPVKLKVNKLTSDHNPLPYRFYYLPYCMPERPPHEVENLGEVLRGDRIFTASNINITAGLEIKCQAVSNCLSGSKATILTQKNLERYQKFIIASYRAHWIVDNMEGAVLTTMVDGSTRYQPGYPIGCLGGSTCPFPADQGATYLNNHVSMTIQFHSNPDSSSFRIVGFFLDATSVDYGDAQWATWEANQQDPSTWNWAPENCGLTKPLKIDPKMTEKKIIFTYSVKWEASEKLWAERWNPYFYSPDADVHWFSIINSLMISLFLAGMVAMILLRTLNADVDWYNRQKDKEEQEEETGWKLVHGDVFRPPEHRTTLAMLTGTGVQILSLSAVTMLFALLGFLSPANRGGLGTAAISLFVVMSAVGGYFSTRIYKQMRGTAWKRVTLYTALFLPGSVSLILFVLNFFVWSQGSSAAIPFTTMLAVLALWLGISVPLTFCGGYFADRKPIPDPPLSTNVIPRMIPSQVWYMHPVISILMGGVLPFGAVFIELFFILTAIWANQYYYLFGFLFLVFLILVITSAEISLVICYFQLCGENWAWWWRSFLTSGASAFYMFGYSVLYYQTQLDVFGFVPSLMYFTYSFLMSFIFFIVTGTIGFLACFIFVSKIYARLHLD